ncbi:hypothetical protein M513_05284 [Trichuris suis]|uniref:Uncharacterized protein n=1 Tax=Trichuris suis TaxID=68888 RepID=A0A085M982_9BILA|nr:hypothetical protein M513_05284 [Trichuris suis]
MGSPCCSRSASMLLRKVSLWQVPYNRYVTFTECVWLCFYKTEREGQFREFHEFHPLAWNLRNSQI